MAGQVALSQALSYARDLKALYEASQARERDLATTNDRLCAAYQQSLRYAADLKKTYRQLERSVLQSLLGLANALEAKDPYTRGHSERVARSARRLALAVGLPPGSAETIAHAGLLHDLGKIAVPEAILRKPAPLTEEEWRVMRQHPLTGAQIVSPLECFEEEAVIIRHHHERPDGSGYPDGLGADRIPLGARIVAIADMYDALASDRPYRRRLPQGDVVRCLREAAGRTLDGRLTTAFLALISDGSPEPGL
jgi:HD-GYP domain-containing protein (c-di-GMP phosphodiesterase class II)